MSDVETMGPSSQIEARVSDGAAPKRYSLGGGRPNDGRTSAEHR